MVADEAEVARGLHHRIVNSSGGTFLITGFRGVGKTTAVQRALGKLSDGTGVRVIDVIVPVARPVEPVTLLFEVIRRLVERLQELELIERLTPAVRKTLLLAYARTSLAYKETQSRSEETRRAAAFGGAFSAGKGVSLPLPRWSRSRTNASSYATELAFLAYADSDAEHDFMRIVSLLGRPDAAQAKWIFRSLAWTRRTKRTTKLNARLVIVFDEIDKLTEPAGGRTAFDTLLGGLKNLLAAGGVHFVVVAGMDLHDEWLRETATANSLYRSVFAWQCYTPCCWGAARPFLDDVTEDADRKDLDALAGYLEYRGRGIVRNILYELNELVDWDERGPFIELDEAAEQRVRLFGELAALVDRSFGSTSANLLAAPSDRDRLCQAAYYIIDWALRTEGDPFTVDDVLDTTRPRPIDPVLQPSAPTVRDVLDALVDDGVLTKRERDAQTVTQVGESERKPHEYRLATPTLARLERIAESPRGRAEIGREPAGSSETSDGSPRHIAARLLGSRYRLEQQLGRGAFGTVWRAVEIGTGVPVVVKVMPTDTDDRRRRAEQEIRLLVDIDHPNVSRVRHVVRDHDRIAIVTELVPGRSLDQAGALPPADAVRIVSGVLEALAELHRRGVVHRDVKPSNIVVADSEAHPVLIDFGIAAGPGLHESTFAGTPAYSAPERFLGAPAGPRSDLYSTALVLLELLTGERIEVHTSELLRATITRLPVSRQLRSALRRGLQEDPERRFASAADMLDALRRAPEASPGDGKPPDNG